MHELMRLRGQVRFVKHITITTDLSTYRIPNRRRILLYMFLSFFLPRSLSDHPEPGSYVLLQIESQQKSKRKRLRDFCGLLHGQAFPRLGSTGFLHPASAV